MKVRLRGNSVRLRLLKSEVRRLVEEGVVRETVRFSPEQALAYSVESRDGIDRIGARFESRAIRVILPKTLALEWALSTEVSLVAEQSAGNGEMLQLLIEKDFTCLNPRAVWQEDQSDNFSNPNPTCGGKNDGRH